MVGNHLLRAQLMEYARTLTTRHAGMDSATERWVTNLTWQSFTLELVEITADNKDGPAMAKQFGEIVDHTETAYECVVIYFTTDADGGSKKGGKLPQKARPCSSLLCAGCTSSS